MLTTGQRFAGYELQELVADGDMGTVYKARDVRLGRQVALRIVAPDLARDPVIRARLNRESTVLASLDHPNVAPIYEAGEHDGRIFIASRWIAGTSLSELVRQNGPLEVRRAVRIALQVASALEAAHRLGIMHRNVKPSNVLVTGTGLTYLTDFGLARRSDDLSGLTAERHLVESYDYVAPEYINGGEIDSRVDIYGLGCVLYEALTAEVPYPRSGPAAKMYAHLSSPPPSPRQRNPLVPEQLDEVDRQAMAKDPGDRQQTPAEFALAAASAVELSAPPWATTTVPGEAARDSSAPPAPVSPDPIPSRGGDQAASAPVQDGHGADHRGVPAQAEAVPAGGPGAQDGAAAPASGAVRDRGAGMSPPPAAPSLDGQGPSASRDGQGPSDGAGPALAEPAGTADDYYDAVYFVDRRRPKGRILLWIIAVLVFIAAPVALVIALVH